MSHEYKAAMIIIICGIIGVLFALVLQMMNSDGLLVSEILTETITLRVVQAVVILVWTVMGVIFAVATQ